MRIKKVNSDATKLYETSQVKFKVVGNAREVQCLDGNNKMAEPSATHIMSLEIS